MRRLDYVGELVFVSQRREGKIEGELPGSEHAVIALVRVGLIGAFGGTERVVNVPIGLCGGGKSIADSSHCQ